VFEPAHVDPEEAFVASISSCHMLTFLHVARLAGFQIESYEDEAVGDMAKNERGVAWVAVVTLNPKIVYAATSARRRAGEPSCITRRTTAASSHSP
jgi:organic hydroperoxide reductase OsmC/OhrA